jgi:cytochrome c
MKALVIPFAAAAGLMLATGVHAADAKAAEALAKASGCMTCHTAEKKLIGPSFKDIAAKNRASKGAEALLIKHVKEGSKGVWGEIPMPPNAHVKDPDIKTMVQWILTLK